MRVNHQARAAQAEQRRARTRERLLDAAERVVAEKGVENASIDEFVAAAGVSRGTFYNYFPTASDLVNALNVRVAAHVDDVLDRLPRQNRTPAALLALIVHTVLAAYLADPVRGWVALQIASSRAPRVRTFEDRFAAVYADGVRQGQFRPADLAAARTVAFGSMRMIQGDVVAGTASATQAVDVVALVLAGFGLPYEEALEISREEAAVARGN